jgi:hypothetical protein
MAAPGEDCSDQPAGGAAVSLGGAAGWQTVIENASSYASSPDGITRTESIVALRGEYCFSLTAYFADDFPDDSAFRQIVESFIFQGAS